MGELKIQLMIDADLFDKLNSDLILLEAERDRLRAALEKIDEYCGLVKITAVRFDKIRKIAKEALDGK